jgi:Ca2+-binding RTX toxin-like protein
MAFLFGNNLNNFLAGGSSDDYIYGYGGNDYLIGNGGNDVIYGGFGNDDVRGGDGNDSLYGDDGNDSLYGGTGSDYLIGGSGNDLLVGGTGADTLTGGIGSDRFYFSSLSDGIDRITDFSVFNDKISVRNVGFGLSLGSISSSLFKIGSMADTSSQRFIYNRSTGGLFFDPDGSGNALQTQFATLSTGLALTSANFVVENLFV